MRHHRTAALLFALMLLTAGCAQGGTTPAPADPPAQPTAKAAAPAAPTEPLAATEPPAEPAAFAVSSAGIVDGAIGDAYGMRGSQMANGVPTRSLPLTVEGGPEGTACLALSMIDPDGGDWVHWLALVPLSDLPENASIDWADRMTQGKNDFGSVGYGGPTPPSGTHVYVLTVYALSEQVSLENGFSLAAFTKAIDGKALAQVELTGSYAS